MEREANPPALIEPLFRLMAPLFAEVESVTAPEDVRPAAPMFMLLLLERTKSVEAVDVRLMRAPALAMSTAPPALAESEVVAAVERAVTPELAPMKSFSDVSESDAALIVPEPEIAPEPAKPVAWMVAEAAPTALFMLMDVPVRINAPAEVTAPERFSEPAVAISSAV